MCGELIIRGCPKIRELCHKSETIPREKKMTASAISAKAMTALSIKIIVIMGCCYRPTTSFSAKIGKWGQRYQIKPCLPPHFPLYASQGEPTEEEEEEISAEQEVLLKGMETLYPTSEEGYVSVAKKRAEFAKAVKEKALAEGMDEDAAAEAAVEAAKTFTLSGDTSFKVKQGDRLFSTEDGGDDKKPKEEKKEMIVTDSNIVIDAIGDDDEDEPKLLLF